MCSGAGSGYYSASLSGERLRKCYQIAPARVRQYLEAEIEFVLSRIRPGDAILELGCGYGRIALRLASVAGRVVGIDTAAESLALARELALGLGADSICEFLEMDASSLTFGDSHFDVVICAQNGVCAFDLDREVLLREALRVTQPGGRVLFSTYASRFWDHRVQWFEAQARAGLIGELDTESSGAGTIVCRDGLRLGSLNPGDFEALGARVGLKPTITEVDGSSLFAEWVVAPEAA